MTRKPSDESLNSTEKVYRYAKFRRPIPRSPEGRDPVPESVEEPTLRNPWSGRNLLLAVLGLFLVAFAAEATRDLTRRFLRNDVPVTSAAVERSDIRRTFVSSSAMRSVGYDQERRVLEIEFTNGAVYQYFDVPAEVYRGLMGAESHGRYFHQHVRDAGYRYQRMN